MASHKITRTTSVSGRSVTSTQEATGEVGQTFELTIADLADDVFVAAAFAIAKLKSIIITVTEDTTLETNDGGTPVDTINLKAISAFQWGVGEERANPFTVDVTGFYFTSSDSGDAVVKIELLYDEI